MRTRAKPAVKLVFEPSRLRIRGRGPSRLSFAELHEDVAFSWKEQDQELATRQLARALVMNRSEAERSASSYDHVLRDEDGIPVVAVFCTDEVAVELELRVLILLRRRREREAADRREARRNFRRRTQLPHRTRKILLQQQQEQGQFPSSRTGGSTSAFCGNTSEGNISSSCGNSVSRATTSSSHGGGSAADSRSFENLDSGLGSAPPARVGQDGGGSGTHNNLELSTVSVHEILPGLLDTQEVIGGGMTSPADALPSIGVFDSRIVDWAAGDPDNLFGLSQEQHAELSNMFAANTAAAAAAAATNTDPDPDIDPGPDTDHHEAAVQRNVGGFDHIDPAFDNRGRSSAVSCFLRELGLPVCCEGDGGGGAMF
eukprot:g18192.t1